MEDTEVERRRMSEELDEVLVELMDCLDRLAALRRRFSREVSEGYFNLAKARYSMGPLSVTQLQYDSVMAPTCLVEVDGVAPGNQDPDEAAPATKEETVLAPPHGAEFRVYRPTPSGGRGREGREGGRENQPRRRRPQTGEPEPGGERVEEVGGREGGKAPKNPLNWFGVLVPRTLRQSQESFIRATGVCGELATQQSRLETLRKQYISLSLRKQQPTDLATPPSPSNVI